MRSLERHRGFAAVAILSLGVAIALNTTMYGVLATLLASRLDVRSPEQVYSLTYLGDPAQTLTVSTIEEGLRSGVAGYAGITGMRPLRIQADGRQLVAERGNRFLRVSPLVVRHDFFEFLGTRSSRGRLFLPDDDGRPVAVISDRLARRLFGDDNAVGQSFLLDGDLLTIVGVVERYAGYRPLASDVWMLRPSSAPDVRPSLIRLRDAHQLATVKEELTVIGSRLAMAAGQEPHLGRFWIRPVPVARQLMQFHGGMAAAVVAVLLVACANLANLQLARGLARTRELALRAAVGASRLQLVRHLLFESGILATAGLALGVLLTLWGIAAIRSYIPPEIDGYFVAPQVSWRMFTFAACAALACLFLTGLLPALQVSRVDPNVMLRDNAGTGASRTHRRRHGVLVVAQIAFALPVLVGAVVVLQGARQMHSGEYLSRQWYGYDPLPIVTTSAPIPGQPGVPVAVAPAAAALVERVRRVPQVIVGAASIERAPQGRMVTAGDDDGRVRELMAHQWSYKAVSPEYFRVYGRAMRVGRDFRSHGDELSVIVDAPTARYLWGQRNPIGRALKLAPLDTSAPWYTVVGVLDDMRDTFAIRRTMRDANFRLYGVFRPLSMVDSVAGNPASNRTAPGLRLELHARVRGNAELASIRLQRELRGMHPDDRPVVTPLLWWLGSQKVQQDFVASLFVAFALVAIALVAIGVAGIVSYSVAERRHELAVRISLGATARDVLHAVLREGNVLILAGVAVGLFLTRDGIWWLGPFVNDDIGYDAVLFACIALSLLVFAAAAALIPAWRATRIDPVQALRQD